jgi:uncharacterized protein (TIGR02611 family)
MSGKVGDVLEWNMVIEGQREGGVLSRPAADVPPPAVAWKSGVRRVMRLSRKVGVAVAGGSLLILGVALIVLPGPAIVVIPLGLALLATEFRWAGRLLRYLEDRASRAARWGRRALARA